MQTLFIYLLLLLVAYLLWNISGRTFVTLLNNIFFFNICKSCEKTKPLHSLNWIKYNAVSYVWNIFKWVFQSKTPQIFHILKSI